MALSYEQLEQNIISWANRQPDIRAIIVIGSRAREDHPADDWSDLDLIIFTSHPSAYLSTTEWLAELGEVWLECLNYTARGDPEWLALFAGAVKADFVLVTIPEDSATSLTLQQMMDATPYNFVYQRGLRVLVDKNGGLSPLDGSSEASEVLSTSHPTAEAFLALINRVLLDAVRTAKMLKRGELWRAKQLCDGSLKQKLLTMLEWHARATNGLPYETWHEGRFLHQWADSQAIAALPQTFATYQEEALWPALFATLALFRRLAQKTGQRLGYEYPISSDKQITEWIKRVQNS